MLKTKNLGLIVLGLMLSVQSCDSQSGQNEGMINDNIEYTFVTNAEGEKPEDGEIIIINMMYKDANDSILGNSQDFGAPFGMKKDSLWGNVDGFEDCLNILDKGDSAVFKVPAKVMFKQQLPPGIDPESLITVAVGLEDIMSETDYMTMMNDFQTQQRIEQVKMRNAQTLLQYETLIQEDGEKIDQFLTDSGLEAQKTASGLRYIIREEGDGAQAVAGKNVQVNYTGRVMGGDVFDTSLEEVAKENDLYDANRPYQPLPFPLGTGRVIAGWDEGIALLKEGSKATLYIPSPWAYGERGAGEIIQPNSILVFDVELVEVSEYFDIKITFNSNYSG